MIDIERAKKVARMVAAVGEPTRMAVLHRLAESPRHVGELAELAGVPMVNMSHHLGVLRLAGLVQDVKTGRRVLYSLHPEVYEPSDAPEQLGVLNMGPYKMILARPASKGRKKKSMSDAAAAPQERAG